MELKCPLTYDEQVDKLQAHGILILNRESAKAILSKVSYYRLTGFALEYRTDPRKSDYIQSVSIEQIYRIYKFDVDLRDILRKYIEIAEVYYRTQISYGFSMVKCLQPPHEQHYDANNFYHKSAYLSVMDSLKKETGYNHDSLIVRHHQRKYGGKMPLWVIVELLSFSNLSKLYNSMYISEKQKIADAVGTGYEVLENHLHCLSVLRNKCAHAARLYNCTFNPPARLPSGFLRKNPTVKNDTLFAYVLVLLARLPDRESKIGFVTAILTVLENYTGEVDLSLCGIPENYVTVLSKYL